MAAEERVPRGTHVYGAPHEPERIEPRTLSDYLEVLTRAVFQAGMAWRVVEAKWPLIREAFGGFDPETVAGMTEADVERLVHDRRVIRNRLKLRAVIENARTLLEIDREHGGFDRWLGAHAGYEETAKDLKARFSLIGDTAAYFFLAVVGEDVPPYAEWASVQGRSPR